MKFLKEEHALNQLQFCLSVGKYNIEITVQSQQKNFTLRKNSRADINMSIFILEDFNKRIMTPELTPDELKILHKEATDLYDLYFRSNAKHKVNVDQNIVIEIFESKTNYHEVFLPLLLALLL